MNKTKRKIFETSMKLFAEKGYDATSIEEITSTVGVAKGTLYYHFSSKEEIFNFLVEEGVKLLRNSIEIKTQKLNKTMDKLKAIILIEIKIMIKYEDFMTILLSQIWGNEPRNKVCKNHVFDCIKVVEQIIKEGIENGEIVDGSPDFIATELFSIICSSLMYKLKTQKDLDIKKIYSEYEKTLLRGLHK